MRKLKNVYYLSISGIKFSVAMEKEIEITRAFFPFVTNQQHTDFKACFQKVNELPLTPEETLYEDNYDSFEDFSKAIEEYINNNNNERIQAKTKWMPPVKYREASMCA